MEEADLLKQRLQAITKKRRIQEDIANKRRQIEEEKLKLQYMKKKALREQWLMDGLSQQSEQEQEAMKLQTQDEQHQSDQLQSNILRIQGEIKDLEAEELNISINEEVVLKQLKEVEKTAGDIIQKATVVNRETNGKELNKGYSTTENQNAFSITMETAEQSQLLLECEVEVTVTDSPKQVNDFSAKDEQICLESDSSASLRKQSMLDTLLTERPTTTEVDNLSCSETSIHTEIPQVEKPVFILQGYEELNRNESITSSLSDTLSSADSIYENEAHNKRKDKREQDQEQEQTPESGNPEQEPGPERYPEPEQQSGREDNTEAGQYPEPEQDPELKLYPKQVPDQEHELELYSEPEIQEILFEPHIADDSILEHCIKEEAMSDVSNESFHDLEPNTLNECLTVEIAAASSDSETDEKWRTIFSSSINKEDDDSYLDSLQLSAQDLFVQKAELPDFEEEDNNFKKVCFEVPKVEEVLEQPKDIISFPIPTQEVKYNPLGCQSLSKISEDDGENGKDANHNPTTHQHHIDADQNKKVPKDFCVIQETKSENVSTEHVDFQLARKQWQEMEEQTNNKILLPTTMQPSFRSSRSFMYTPVRNIDRGHNKVHDLESLHLVGDCSHNQFSPCSEDSGLDDSSYRSPYEDPETPAEKEICQTMEREEHLRREKGFPRMGKSIDCAPSQNIPRSISTPLTPSFIITSSPTKEPFNHDVLANNVLVLNPNNDFTSHPSRSKDNVASRSDKWHSEDSNPNLIILETSNLIIRSASEFSLNKVYEQPQEKMFLNNPFFKLRSRSTVSLVDEEIKLVKQRDEELRKERASLYNKDRGEGNVSNHMDTLQFDISADAPVKCKSSPSSPMKTCRMDRSALSCDHRFAEVYTGGRRKSAMALRWEAGEFTKNN